MVALLAFALASPQMLHTWYDMGSPIWPFSAPGFPGDAAMAASFARGADRPIDWLAVAICEFVLGWPALPSFVNLGPAALVAGVVAVASVRRVRLVEPGVLLIAAIAFLAFALPLGTASFRSQLAIHLVNNGRLMLVPFTILVLAACASERWVAALAIIELGWAIPTGFAASDLRATAMVGVIVAAIAAVGALGRRTPLFVAFSPVLVGIVAVGIDAVRAATRSDVRASAASPSRVAFWHRFLPTGQHAVDAWPLWAALDDGAPHTVAYLRGYDGDGMGIFRYPLFGSRLQNTVLSVPDGRDGRVLDHAGLDPADLDEQSWLRAVDALGVDRVWIAEPAPLSAAFVERHPERFELVGERAGPTRLYQVIGGSTAATATSGSTDR